jgi:hypothetical protein
MTRNEIEVILFVLHSTSSATRRHPKLAPHFKAHRKPIPGHRSEIDWDTAAGVRLYLANRSCYRHCPFHTHSNQYGTHYVNLEEGKPVVAKQKEQKEAIRSACEEPASITKYSSN